MDSPQELENISKAMGDLTTKLESGYLSKSEFKFEANKFAETFKAFDNEINKLRKQSQTDPVFGNKSNAQDFVNLLKVANSHTEIAEIRKLSSDKNSSWYVEKDLNSYTSGAGIDTIPTATADVLSLLIKQYGLSRRYATVWNDVHGNLALPKRNGTSSAVFTVAASTNEDDASVTPSAYGTAKLSLTPQQISILSLVSDKLLFQSAVNIAEYVAIDMAEQAGILEDNTTIYGDGTTTYGGNTGLVNTLSAHRLLVPVQVVVSLLSTIY